MRLKTTERVGNCLCVGYAYAVPMGNSRAMALVRRLLNLRGWWDSQHHGWRPWERREGGMNAV